MARMFFLILLVAVLAVIQVSGFSLLGVKPNLALVGAAAVSFFLANIFEGFLLAALAAFILKFSPAPGGEIAIFFIVAVFAGIIARRLPWRGFLNNLAVVFLSTFAFYLFAGIEFIGSAFFLKEIALNVLLGGLIFYFLSLCVRMEKINRKIHD